MTKPDDIPQDVWDEAQTFAFGETGDLETDTNILVARAILAERERCKLLAHAAGRAHGETGAGAACMRLALDIIEGKAA